VRVIHAKVDRPYFESWLRRTRKQFATSGRLTEIALILSREDGGSEESWRGRLRELLEGGEMPGLDFLTRIDGLLSGSRKKPAKPDMQQLLF
jgi:hypothetical protein